MGGAVSAGDNNDELIDNLVEANYITSKKVEEVFRAVDRGHYFLEAYRDSAYHDLAWRHEHLHISAPCIYSKVLSAMELKPGLSFLNIGSGTGYFSTLVGLVLGSSGINHGIELHEDVVKYANDRVKEFVLKSTSFDRYTFCEPQFVIGNCLHISPDTATYDRIYCGAACPLEYESFMKNLLNISGILIMPLNDQLQVIRRTGQSSWESNNILVVNFANLIVPSEDEKDKVAVLPRRDPLSLYSLCRLRIRRVLSEKYHHGSNRRFKRKIKRNTSGSYLTSISIFGHSEDQEIPSRRRRYAARRRHRTGSDDEKEENMRVDKNSDEENLPDLVPDEDNLEDLSNSSSSSDDDSHYQPFYRSSMRSSILNVVTGTLTTVRGGQSNTSNDRTSSTVGSSSDDVEKKKSSSNSFSQSGSSSSSQKPKDENDGNQSSETPKKKKIFQRKLHSLTKTKRHKREDKRKDKREDLTEKSKAKRGWAYIRQRFRNRKNENSIFSKRSQETATNTSDTKKSEEMDEDDEKPSTRETSSGNSGPVETEHQISLHFRAGNQMSLRSILYGVASQLNNPDTSTSDQYAFRDNLFGYLTDSNQRRRRRRVEERRRLYEDEESSQSEEITPPSNEFSSALLRLPLPEQIKQFLLFYRTPN